jgi:hypothetical protein
MIQLRRKSLKKLVTPAGLEPATFGLETDSLV